MVRDKSELILLWNILRQIICTLTFLSFADDRKLQKSLQMLNQNLNKRVHEQNLQQISFNFHTNKRRESWTREDKFRLDRLNFPQLKASDRKLQSASVQQVGDICNVHITVIFIDNNCGNFTVRVCFQA